MIARFLRFCHNFMKFYSAKRITDLLTFALVASFFVFSIQSIQASGMTSAETVNLVNEARTSQDLPELAVNEKLVKAAEAKIDDMIKNDYFAHTSPTGATPWTWFEKVGYDYKFAGENLAINFSSAEDQQAAWMNSETHKENILSPNYKEIGAAVKEETIDGKSTTITVQEFGAQNIYAATDGNGEVAGAENCKPIPWYVFALLLLAYAGLINFHLWYRLKEQMSPRWVWEAILTVASLVAWFYLDWCRTNTWFIYAVIIAGFVSYLIYLQFLRKSLRIKNQ